MRITDRSIAVGVDIGGTNVKLALVDRGGAVIAKKIIPTGQAVRRRNLYLRLKEAIERMMQRDNISWQRVKGIGIGVPGLLNSDSGRVFFAPNLDWKNVNLVEELKQIFNVPIAIQNDANVAVLGEAWKGAGTGVNNIVMLTIGTGVGSGVVINGRLYAGQGVASEIGHMVIDPRGPNCSCGSSGCMEALVAAPAIKKRALEKGIGDKRLVGIKEIFSRAEAGERKALEVISTSAEYLGIGIANVINIFNPEVVIVGGGVAKGGNLLMKPAVAVAKRYSLDAAMANVSITTAQLENDAGVVGAAGLLFQKR